MPTPLAILVLIGTALQTVPPSEAQCGTPYNVIHELIHYGHSTVPGEWPWHAAIYQKTAGKRTFEYVCGGTLIADRFVLTAAHCVVAHNGFTIANNLMLVRLGVHDLDEMNAQIVQQRRVHQIHTTGNYARPSKRDDIALIEMENPVMFNDFVQPACVNQEANLTGRYGTAVGWGVTENDTVSSVLKKVDMPVIDHYVCLNSNRGFFGKTLDWGIFCAGYHNGTAVCNGDSGGGLFFERGAAWYVGGIVSFSIFRDISGLCSTKNFAAFTSVYHFLPWIKETLRQKLPVVGISYKVNLLPTDCGQSITHRIPRGNVTRVFAYPWMAKLQYNESGVVMEGCDGSLINNRYILTSAFCLVRRVGLLFAVLGEHTRDQDEDCNIYHDSRGVEIERQCAGPVEFAFVESYVVHPGYDADRAYIENNIGLARLANDVVMKDHIRPICLPVTPLLRSTQLNSYVVVGYGVNTKYSLAQVEATVPWVSNSECLRAWNVLLYVRNITDEHLCVRDQLVAPCLARPGEPLGFVANHNGERFVQFGIWTIWHNSNCTVTGVPTIYTRVAYFMDWILENIEP